MKKLFKKILLPMQLEEGEPDAAIRLARELAKRDNAEIVLMHVVPMLATGDAPMPVEYYKRQEAEARKTLEKLARRFVRLETEVQVVCGDPAEAILHAARESGVAATVMATHGRRGLKHLILGSVAERVVREAHCPVVTVPPPV